ncbi:uncharacterized protein JCM6883_005260 [Sporobolomyces salmoneus]|uniref:uncharacterized protein n=1 Tax=Sporobolomyces salmoneus TaxID=183962 RepID=UPI003178E65F
MSTTRTKPPLIYSLSTRPPIPFPLHPSYPIEIPTQDLPSAYLDSLWTSTQPDQVSLESFARLLLSLKAQKSPIEVETLLRTLLRPLHDFDKRWRSVIPDLLEEEDEEESPKGDELTEQERELIRKAYEKWEVVESKRLEEEKARRKAKGKEKARDLDRMDEDEEEDEDEQRRLEEEDDEPNLDTWVSDREVYETRLQALILLTLISLPPSARPPSPVQKKKGKGKKKQDPERDATTLDPALMLDFLTDRLQIWRVMQGLALEDELDGEEAEKKEVVETRDTVQEWWADIVEPLYRNNVNEEALLHHRIKLFPDATNDSSSKTQAALYEERSLMSLDKSARRRDLRESQAIISESPTMKRLMSKSSLGGGKPKSTEIFKVPLPPLPRNSSSVSLAPTNDGDDSSMRSQEKESTTRPRLPRKQERPRPLPRGDSAATNMKDILKRREVSMARKTSVTGVKKKGKTEGEAGKDGSRKRKRKSASPQKLTTSSGPSETITLVPDTPAKPLAKAASFKKPFSRAISLPSFAALGAAFRPGAPDPASVPLPFGIPPPPVLPGDQRPGIDWEIAEARGGFGSEEEDTWLLSRNEDFRAKGGRSRNTSGSTEADDTQEDTGETLMETPKKNRVVLVADTPN